MALKVGVVGIRGIGTQHVNAHLADPLSDLVCVCDIIPERADEIAQKHGLKAYYSVDEMLDAEPDLQVVDVTTGGNENGSWHFEPTMQALEAGKHVLCEKPLSNDIEEARDMVAFAAEQGVYLGCNLNHYFTPPAEKAMEYIRAGEIGEQIYCVHRMGFPGGETTYRKPGGFRTAPFPYFHMKAFLTHPFADMRYFCGDITHVQCFAERPGFRRAAGDLMVSVNSINVRFQSGCVGHLLSQRGDTTFGMGGWWSLEVGGSKGTFCIENCIEKVTYWPAPGRGAAPARLDLGAEPEPVVTESGIKDFNQTFPRRIHAFMEDVTNGVPLEALRASGRDALATLEYIWAAIRSYEQGGEMVEPHPLPLLKGDPRTQNM